MTIDPRVSTITASGELAAKAQALGPPGMFCANPFRGSWGQTGEVHRSVPTFLTSHSLVGQSHSLRAFSRYSCDICKHCGKVCIGRGGTSPVVSKSAWVR